MTYHLPLRRLLMCIAEAVKIRPKLGDVKVPVGAPKLGLGGAIPETALALGTIRCTSLKDMVVDSIKSAAIRGEFTPGKLITEIGIARSWGVAQATVWEVL